MSMTRVTTPTHTCLHDASVMYQRSGAYSNGVITWGDWYKYGGEVFTP